MLLFGVICDWLLSLLLLLLFCLQSSVYLAICDLIGAVGDAKIGKRHAPQYILVLLLQYIWQWLSVVSLVLLAMQKLHGFVCRVHRKRHAMQYIWQEFTGRDAAQYIR
eukprot:924605_1